MSKAEEFCSLLGAVTELVGVLHITKKILMGDGNKIRLKLL